MTIDANNIHFRELNKQIASHNTDINLTGVCGQRFLGAALSGKKLVIDGIPGNALGAYLDGGVIEVRGNAQDASGDTMNDGTIIVHGSAGDALGYAMRGGKIFVKGNAGYRAGIHTKEYKDKIPLIVIGGAAGSFLGEYLAGGVIIVLGMGTNGDVPLGNFTGTGMHGGKIFVKSNNEPKNLPEQVSVKAAAKSDMAGIMQHIQEFSSYFDFDTNELMSGKFWVLCPNAKNPYKQLYTTH